MMWYNNGTSWYNDASYISRVYGTTPSENIKNHKYEATIVNGAWSPNGYWCEAQTETEAILEVLNLVNKLREIGKENDDWQEAEVKEFRVYRVLNNDYCYHEEHCIFESHFFDEVEYMRSNYDPNFELEE